MVLAKRYGDRKHVSKALIVELAVAYGYNSSSIWWIGAMFRPKILGQDFAASIAAVRATAGGLPILSTRCEIRWDPAAAPRLAPWSLSSAVQRA